MSIDHEELRRLSRQGQELAREGVRLAVRLEALERQHNAVIDLVRLAIEMRDAQRRFSRAASQTKRLRMQTAEDAFDRIASAALSEAMRKR